MSVPLDKRINYRLGLISHRWSALVASMARTRYRLNPAAMRVLSVIAHYHPVSPGELILRTSSDSPKIARAVASLVDAGLVKKSDDPADGRRWVLSVTRKGAEVNAEIEKLANLVEENVTSALTSGQKEALAEILQTIELALGRQLDQKQLPPASPGKARARSRA